MPALSFENLKMQIAEIEKTDACQRLGELFGALPRYDNFLRVAGAVAGQRLANSYIGLVKNVLLAEVVLALKFKLETLF